MSRNKLTAGRIEAFQLPEGLNQAFLWDADTKQLAVRISSGGKKAFVFQSRFYGKTLRMTIGDVRTWRLPDAQAEARRLQALIDTKQDPRRVAAAERTVIENERNAAAADALKNSILVQSAWDVYIDYQKDKMARPNIERGKKWGDRHLLDQLRLATPGGEDKKRGSGKTLPGVLSPLLQMRMVDITIESLKNWQRKESIKRANKARQGFEAFRAFWRWCAEQAEYRHFIDASVVESKVLRDEVPGRKTKPADSLEREQLPVWFKAIRGLTNKVGSTYLQALLLTGARREEMSNLCWEDVDFRWNSLKIRDKVEGERVIPLTPYLKSLLLELKAQSEKQVETNESEDDDRPDWVFVSPAAGDGKLADPRFPHNRALKEAELPHISLHGLRRSFASLAEWIEMPTGIVAQIMGHKPSATAERHYKRRPLDLLRMWHSKYETWILEQAGVAPIT